MRRVCLEDVSFERRESCKSILPGTPIVGLEHLISGQPTLTLWDTNSDNTFTKVFHKGDILFGRRRAYLQKAAIAPFDGICSGDITVISARTGEIAPELLTFIIQQPPFFEFAMRNSAGSLSPRAKWEDLKTFEFSLPDMDEQRKITDILWGMNDTKDAYKKLLQETDELVKSQFIEMFGSVVSFDRDWPIMTIGEVATSQLGKMLNAKNQTGEHEHLYLANRNVQWFSFDFSDLRKMDFDDKDCKKYELQDNDLLVCEGGEIGRCAIWHGEIEDCYIQNAVHRVRCNTEIMQPLFLGYCLYYHALENGFSDIIGSKATIAHYPADKLKATRVIVPPIDLQNEFIRLAEQSDKSKFAIQQAIKNIEDMMKALINNVTE